MQFNCLDKKQNIFGNNFIEASAGTGKTFAIEHVVLRLLIEEKENLSLLLERILVVTFTKAATRELKLRLFQNIERVLKLCKRAQKEEVYLDPFDYLMPYLKKKDQLQTIIDRLEEALIFFDQAQIFTIHGFCFRMLQEFCFEANLSYHLGESEETISIEKMKKEIAEDYFRYVLSSKDYHPIQIKILMKKYRSIPSLIEKLLLNPNIEKTENLSLGKFFQKCNQLIKSYELSKVDIDFFISLFSNFKKIKNVEEKDLILQFKLLISIIQKKECSIDEFYSLLQTKLSLFHFLQPKNQKKKNSLPKDFFENSFLKLLFDLAKQILPLFDSNHIFAKLKRGLYKKIEKNLEEELFSHDGILDRMLFSLKNKSFLKKVREKYDAAIVDEFQDTDPIQWQIFKTLFLEKKDTLVAFYLIGDPKQSIYGFRKADIYTYLQAAKDFGQKAISHLDTNFRSSQSLVCSLNSLFQKDWIFLPSKKTSMSYLPVKANKKDELAIDTRKPVHFFVAEGKRGISKRWPNQSIEEEKFFPFIANEILTWEKNKKISFSSFAVLVKDRYQAQKLLQFFQRINIPAIYKSQQSISQSSAFSALKELIIAVEKAPSLKEIKLALCGPFMGYSFQELEAIDKELSQFIHLQNILQTQGASLFFQSFLRLRWKREKTVLEQLAKQEDLQFYYDTMQLIEILLEKGSFDKKSFYQIFEEIEKSDPSEDESLRRRTKADEDSVEVMTIHMSKGLEFSIVFALGLASRTPQDSLLDQAISDELDAEKLRQFYVALTRAKQRIYVPIALDQSKKEIKTATASACELFFSSENFDCRYEMMQNFDKKTFVEKIKVLEKNDQVSVSFLDDQQKIDRRKNVFSHSLEPLQKQKISFLQKKVFSFSQLEKSALKINYLPKAESSILPMGTATGVLLHNIFEKIFLEKSRDFFQRKNFQKIIDNEIATTSLLEFGEKIGDIIEKTLHTPLLSSFCLSEIDPKRAIVETEFTYSIGSNFMKGMIDLIFWHKDKFYLIDWKSNYLGDQSNDYEKSRIEQAMDEHNYFLQAAIYTKALQDYFKQIGLPFNEKWGGMLYLFLRGMGEKDHGIYHFYPDLFLLKDVEKKESQKCLESSFLL